MNFPNYRVKVDPQAIEDQTGDGVVPGLQHVGFTITFHTTAGLNHFQAKYRLLPEDILQKFLQELKDQGA